MIVVDADDDGGRTALQEPLHRMFLRSPLGGRPGGMEGGWSIPAENNALEQLQRVLTHFSKYGISCSLDGACSALLEAAEKSRAAFRAIVRAGQKARRGAVSEANKTLLTILDHDFVRHPTKLQLKAVNHLLIVQNGANFSVPGSGKTTVALGYYYLLKKQNLIDALVVIGPGSAFEPWEREYKSCFGENARSVRFAGNSRAKRLQLFATAGKYELFLTTYQSASRDIKELTKLLLQRRSLVILDESHYVKRPEGGLLAETVLALSRHAVRRVILTGTPMPNGLADLWSQFTFLWPNQLPLGSAEEYLRITKQKTPNNSIPWVRDRVSPLIFRITKSELDLPRAYFRIAKCEMSPLQHRIYRGIAAKFLSQLSESPKDRDALREWRLARAIRLLQIAVNPALLRKRSEEFGLPALDMRGLPLSDAIERYAEYEMPNKVALACGLVRQLHASNNKVIVWSTFIQNLRMLAEELRDLNLAVVHGEIPMLSTDSDDLGREALIAKFRDDPDCHVLIANPAACAESISLHMNCHHAIYLDRSFNCAHYLQSLDRIHRLGLNKSIRTYYHLLISTGSIDEIIHARLKEKQKAMRYVIEGDLPGTVPGYWSEDLGNEEVVDLALVEKHIKDLFAFRARKAA